MLPIHFSSHWLSQIPAELNSEKIESWLYDMKSLTQKLEDNSQKFHVKIRQQVTIKPLNNTHYYFNNESKLLIREVFLYCDDIAVVFAQTEIPFSTLTEEQTYLAEIGEQSLGKHLFQDASMKRGEIEVAKFNKNSAAHQLSAQIKQPCEFPLWARRSIFQLNNKPLLVSELFLPASGIYE